MFWQRFLFAITVFTVTTFTGCNREESQKVDLSKTEPTVVESSRKSGALRIAVGGMITPKEGFAYYREFLDYIAAELGTPVEYADETGYDKINDKIKSNEIDAGFVCSGPYVDGQLEFGMELIAAPQAYGKTVYYSYIIVPVKSPARTLDDLRGKSFAFTDPLSNSGKLVPEYILSRKGESSKTFFSKTVFSGSHDNSIKAVSEQMVDGAAVDSLIWEYLNRIKPELTAGTRILVKSDPYAIPPFVVRPGLEPVVKDKLRKSLLNAHNNPKGKELLSRMMIDRFVPIDDKAYNSIREMKKWIAQHEQAKK